MKFTIPLRNIRTCIRLVLAASPLLAAACTSESESVPAPDADMVRIEFNASGEYRAEEQDNNGTNLLAELPGTEVQNPVDLIPLEHNSTLYLVVYAEKSAETDGESAGEGATDVTYSETPQIYAYLASRVTNANAVYTTLTRCHVDSKGNRIETDEQGNPLPPLSPLYLKKGYWYRFRIISPARELIDNHALMIDNGETLIATDERYSGIPGDPSHPGTKATEHFIKEQSDSEGVELINLNPIINQTARMKFTLKTGINVNSIRPTRDCIMISGLQEALPDSGIKTSSPANWSFSTPLKELYGYKNATFIIHEHDMTANSSYTELVGETSILPTKSFSTPLILTMTLYVNYTMQQFMIMITKEQFKPGYMYHYVITISDKNGVIAADWALMPWSTEVVITPKTTPAQ